MYESPYIANSIKLTAKEKGIALKDMLSDLSLGSNTISHMRHNKMISADSLARIADYLGCSVDYLLGRTVSPSELSPEALELASRWDKLDDDGKALVRAELVHAENRTDVPNL